MNDSEIIDLFWQRSENAIVQTDIKYGKLCKRLSNNILNNNSDAEECVSDSYLTLWNKIPEDRPEYFSAYLCRIVKNISCKKLERLTAKKRNAEIMLSFEELEGCVPSSSNPESTVEAADVAKKISSFLRNQSEIQRSVFLRRYWYYDSVKDIAADFDLKEEKVSLILFRMRKKLKTFLETEGYGV